MLFSALICACGEYKLEEESDEGKTPQDVPHTVQIVTRSDNNAQINYPLSVFLFDEGGAPSFSLTKEAHVSNKPLFQTLLLHIIIVSQKGNTPSSYYPASLKTNI